MSYDGGLSVKIENSKLLAILKEYQSMGTFDNDIVNVLGIGKRSKQRQLAIHYAYFDCAYSRGCPKSLDQLTPCLMSFLDDLLDSYVNKDLYSTLKEELKKNRVLIDGNYTYVDWLYYHPDGESLEEERFFYESGEPQYTYVGEQPPDDSQFRAHPPGFWDMSEEAVRQREIVHEQQWLEQSGQYLEKNVEIKIAGSTFVLSGIHDEDFENAVVNAGGVIRKKVSGKTDYLVVDPAHAGESKVAHAIEQREKGKMIHIVHVDLLRAALEGFSPAAEPQFLNAPKTSVKETEENLKEDDDEFGLRNYLLPFDAVVWENEKNDGDMLTCISAGEYVDNNGDLQYRFTCQIDYQEANSAEGFSSDEILDVLAEGFAAERQFQVFDQPKTIMLNKATPVYEPSIGETLNIFGIIVLIQINDWNVGSLIITSRINEADADKNFAVYEFIHQVMSALVVNGKPLPMDRLTPGELKHMLELSSENFNEGKLFSDMLKEPLWADPTEAFAYSETDNLVISCGELQEYKGDDLRIVLPKGITAIGDKVFSFKEIESVTIPEGVTKIGACAFEFCKKLKQVILPSTLIEIGDEAFRDCEKLQKIEFPAGLKRIADNAFKGCNSFRKVEIPDGCISIGSNAFAFCEGMEDIYVPVSVQEIGRDAFDTFNDDTRIHVPLGSKAAEYAKENDLKVRYDVVSSDINTAYSCGHPALVNGVLLSEYDLDLDNETVDAYWGNEKSIILPPGIAKIGESAFSMNSSIESIVIPEGVTEIGAYAFTGCEHLKYVLLPSTLVKICDWAFCSCSVLQEVVLPQGIVEIGDYAFTHCESLREVAFPKGLKEIGQQICVHCVQLESVFIPDSVTKIKAHAFAECSSLRNIILPENLNEIGEGAFAGCSALEVLQVPDSCETIGSGAFRRCNNLKKISLPTRLNIIGTDMFFQCSALKDIEIPSGCVTIKEKAFAFCNNLQNIVIPGNVQTIGADAFMNCHSLASVHIHPGVEIIEKTAFAHCINLKEVSIPSSIKEIGRKTFEGCEALEELVLPDGVQKVFMSAFAGCDNLKRVYIPAKTKINKQGFAGCQQLTIYTEPGSYAEKSAKESGIPVKNEVLHTASSDDDASLTGASNNTAATYAVSADTHLMVSVDYHDRDPYHAEFVFPSNYQIALDHERYVWFNWKECNKPDSVVGDDVGIDGVVNFTCRVSADNTEIGGLFDALMEIGKDDLFDEFHAGINHGVSNGSAIAVAMAVLSQKDDNWQCQWILFDFLSLQAQTGISDIVGTEEEAVTKAKILTQSLSAALKDQLERIRKASEETERKELERKQQEEAAIAERKRQEDAEFERKRQEALAAQRARHDELSHEISLQMQLISQNKGWFGKQAQIRKEAQNRLEVLQKQLAREFPNGKP